MEKIPSDTTGNRLVAQCLNHYATQRSGIQKLRIATSIRVA